jgi:hypothetical protein
LLVTLGIGGWWAVMFGSGVRTSSDGSRSGPTVPLLVAEGVAVIVDATVLPALVPIGFGIPGLTTSVSEYELTEGDLGHRDFDKLLDVDAHDCVRGAGWCYGCAVQQAQRDGRRV